MVFISKRDGNAEVYSSIGGVVTRVTNTTVSESEPAWSPDGTKIVFVSNTSSPTSLWIMNTDGSSPAPLPLPADSDGVHGPHWSGNGSQIVYSRGSTTLGQEVVTIMQYPSGTSADIVFGYDPQFGPGDATILYASREGTADGNSEIWSWNLAGSMGTQRTFSLGHDDFTPVYFKAEDRIAWVEWVGILGSYTGSVLKKMELNGSGQTNVYNVAGHEPDWPTGAGAFLYFTVYDGVTEKIWKLKSDGTSVILDFGGPPDTTPSVKGG